MFWDQKRCVQSFTTALTKPNLLFHLNIHWILHFTQSFCTSVTVHCSCLPLSAAHLFGQWGQKFPSAPQEKNTRKHKPQNAGDNWCLGPKHSLDKMMQMPLELISWVSLRYVILECVFSSLCVQASPLYTEYLISQKDFLILWWEI